MFKSIILAATAAIGLTVAAHAADPSPDPTGVNAIRFLLREEARTYVRNGAVHTAFDWSEVGLDPSAQMATVKDMRAAFAANEIGAERRFGKTTTVTGTLDSVARDGRGILVRFREGGIAADQRKAFSGFGMEGNSDDPGRMIHDMTGGLIADGAQAILPDSYADSVADWQPGQQIELQCHSAANSHLALLLDGCRPLAAVQADAEKVADRQVDLFFARKPLEIVPTKDDKDDKETGPNMMALIYTLAVVFPECKNGDDEARLKCLEVKKFNRSNPRDPTVVHMKQVIADLDNPLITAPQHWPNAMKQ
jgi:hypothetical protein